MDNKTECDIVQDLLFGYADNVLNKESKRLVENHLISCLNCQKKFEEIKIDSNDIENNQKKEIDYLKKIRRKNKIKSFFIAIGIIFLVIFIFYFIKFLKINSIINKGYKSLEHNNIYMERTDSGYDGAFIYKTYLKDGKFKEVHDSYTSDGSKGDEIIIYGEVNGGERVTIYENEKRAVIEKGEQIKKIYTKDLKLEILGPNNIFLNLGKAFLMTIDEDNYLIGKDYYILKYKSNPKSEYWIDKETGLKVMEFNKESVAKFIPGTFIIQEFHDNISSYEYKFDLVTDEDVTIPDLSEYKIEYNDTIEKLLEEANEKISQEENNN